MLPAQFLLQYSVTQFIIKMKAFVLVGCFYHFIYSLFDFFLYNFCFVWYWSKFIVTQLRIFNLQTAKVKNKNIWGFRYLMIWIYCQQLLKNCILDVMWIIDSLIKAANKINRMFICDCGFDLSENGLQDSASILNLIYFYFSAFIFPFSYPLFVFC